jgi:predicted membrane metal-binding protein
LPGIYLYPITSLISAVIVFENSSLGNAFDRGFKLIKGNWWVTFGALFIIIIVFAFAAMLAFLPITFIATGSLLFSKYSVSMPILIIRTILSSLVHVFMILPYVVVALSYFSLVESKDGEGLLDRVNSIGQNGSDSNLPEEQY